MVKRFRQDLAIEGIYLAGTDMTATAAELNILDGATVTTAELNKLDGVAANATEIDQRVLNTEIQLGTAGQTYVVSPFAGNVTAIYSVVNGAVDNTDEVLTAKNAAGSTIGNLTLTAGDPAGTVDSTTSNLSSNSVSVGDAVEVETDGGSGATEKAVLTILIDIT